MDPNFIGSPSAPLSNSTVLFRLTGSNQILMDKNIRESLARRASYYYLNTLTAHEILAALPETTIHHILFKGGCLSFIQTLLYL